MANFYRHVQAIIGWLFIGVGLIVLPLPIPLGAIMIVVGIAMVAPHSPVMRRILTRIRRRFPGFDRQLERWYERFPAFVQRLIDQTRPNGAPPTDPPGTPAQT